MLLIKKALERLPRALRNKAGAAVSFCRYVLMGAIMIFIVNPPMGAFNEWLNSTLAGMGEGSRILLGIVLSAA